LGWLLGGNFPTRDQCGEWERWMVVANQWSDGLIALAYFAIPATLLYFYCTHRKHIPSNWMLLCFAAFITLCGLTHLTQVVVFWTAPYRLFTVVKIVTAVMSVGTMFLLPLVVRHLKSLPSVESYRVAVAERDAEIASRAALESDLLLRIAQLEETIRFHSHPQIQETPAVMQVLIRKQNELLAQVEGLRSILPSASSSVRLRPANGGGQ
jgi:hypothetical protein